MRRIIFESFVAGGGGEPYVNNAHLETVAYANLWEGRMHILDGVGHAPFWEAPARFDPIPARFLGDVVV